MAAVNDSVNTTARSTGSNYHASLSAFRRLRVYARLRSIASVIAEVIPRIGTVTRLSDRLRPDRKDRRARGQRDAAITAAVNRHAEGKSAAVIGSGQRLQEAVKHHAALA